MSAISRGGDGILLQGLYPPRGPYALPGAYTHDITQLVLSDPISGSSGNIRWLFIQSWNKKYEYRIEMQKIDDATLHKIGKPEAFRTFKDSGRKCATCEFSPTGVRTVAIAPGGDVVFYAAYSADCDKQLLNAQVINPQSGAKIGTPQPLIGCNDLKTSQTGIYGIDVTHLAP